MSESLPPLPRRCYGATNTATVKTPLLHDHDRDLEAAVIPQADFPDPDHDSISSNKSGTFKVPAEIVSDAVLGLSDGLTVPFALTAGLSADSYRATSLEASTLPAPAKRQIISDVLSPCGLTSDTIDLVISNLDASSSHGADAIHDFIMRFHYQAPQPPTNRALISALTLGMAYFAGGFIPLIPYFFVSNVLTGLYWSIGTMAFVLLAFGYVKSCVVSGWTGKENVRNVLSINDDNHDDNEDDDDDDEKCSYSYFFQLGGSIGDDDDDDVEEEEEEEALVEDEDADVVVDDDEDDEETFVRALDFAWGRGGGDGVGWKAEADDRGRGTWYITEKCCFSVRRVLHYSSNTGGVEDGGYGGYRARDVRSRTGDGFGILKAWSMDVPGDCGATAIKQDCGICLDDLVFNDDVPEGDPRFQHGSGDQVVFEQIGANSSQCEGTSPIGTKREAKLTFVNQLSIASILKEGSNAVCAEVNTRKADDSIMGVQGGYGIIENANDLVGDCDVAQVDLILLKETGYLYQQLY
ncbi:putative calcium transporter [Phaeomoniella chlamydospora]|uniref:Putative calcium transporter n=1 Tax=Phaeomoniella chlamydospora TaxID=158046 RepID=A0A0G2GQW5_PHACM|nr:putative calcium transporter [Phaeomoniella chlamydospora]